MSYVYYYNSLSEHSSLDYCTLFEVLKEHLPEIKDTTRHIILIMLDKAAVKLGKLSRDTMSLHIIPPV